MVVIQITNNFGNRSRIHFVFHYIIYTHEYYIYLSISNNITIKNVNSCANKIFSKTKIMYKIERQLFFFFGLLAVVQLGNSGPVKQKTVNELISVTSDELGLVSYFKELKLDKYCNIQLLNDKHFKSFEINNTVSYLCTVIYHMNKELECYNVNQFSVEYAKQKTNNNTFNDPTTYNIWKNVSEISPSFKLIMEPLKNITQLKNFCDDSVYNVINFCSYLNVGVWVLRNSSRKPEECEYMYYIRYLLLMSYYVLYCILDLNYVFFVLTNIKHIP